MISALGYKPITVFFEMAKGSIGTATAFRETVKIAIPLLGAAIAIAPAFRMRFWNIGAEGQIKIGAIAASYFALYWQTVLPRPLLLALMIISAMIAGGVWALIPAIFKSKWGTNETLFTLMLNYVAQGIVKYLQHGPWKNPSSTGFPRIAMFHPDARLPRVFGVHFGWIIILAIAIVMQIYLKYTKHGYEIAVVGESERTAKYASMNVSHIIIRTMLISGAIAGLVGCIQVSGADFTLSDNTASGVGFTAITVAWLAKLNTHSMIIISTFLACLTKGSNTIQTIFKIPASAAGLLTGIILFFALGSEFFIEYDLAFPFAKKSKSIIVE